MSDQKDYAPRPAFLCDQQLCPRSGGGVVALLIGLALGATVMIGAHLALSMRVDTRHARTVAMLQQEHERDMLRFSREFDECRSAVQDCCDESWEVVRDFRRAAGR